MPDANFNFIANALCTTAVRSPTTVPTEPVRPALADGLSWAIDAHRSLRIKDDTTQTFVPVPLLGAVAGTRAELYLRAVASPGDIPTPEKVAEARWVAHLLDIERAGEGLHAAVVRLLDGTTASVRLDVPSIIPDEQLDEYCHGIRGRGWTVSVERSPCGILRRMVIASPAVGDDAWDEDPILEVGSRSLRQDMATVLRAESHGALPPGLIARLTERLAMMLDARGQASAETQIVASEPEQG